MRFLQKFADFMRQCETAMSSIGTLNCLNDDRENRRFLSKLPDWIVTRWARITYQWKEDHKGDFPPFRSFVDFISKEAKIASQPVVSLQSLKLDRTQYESKQMKPSGKLEGRSFLAAGDTGPIEHKITSSQCVLCKESHDLDGCKSFLLKSLSERKDFVKGNKLCFWCLRGGHISKTFRNRKKCKTCAKQDPMSLHGDVRDKRNENTFNQIKP